MATNSGTPGPRETEAAIVRPTAGSPARSRAARCAALLCLAPAGAALGVAQDDMSVTPMHASDGGSGDHFSNAVSVSGTAILVGANLDNDFGSDSGSAYVCRRIATGWVQEAKLLPTDGAAGDEFGYAVAIDGDWAVVGSKKDDDLGSNAGSAYVFHHQGGTWTQVAKLMAPDGAAGDYFGSALAIAGDTIAVSSIGDDDLGSYSGSAYVFTLVGTTWSFTQKLLASDGVASDRFGRSVAATDDLLAFGASGVDDHGSSSGAAYVFRRSGSTWTEEAKLTPANGMAGALMGVSIAANGDHVVAGAPEDGGNGPNAGTAYVFRFNGNAWSLETQLFPSDGAGYDQFGRSVSADGSRILVGAHLADGPYPDTGRVYMFHEDGNAWTQETSLESPSAYYWDQFGYSVALSGGVAVAGAIEDDDMGNNAGTAFAFEFDAPTATPCPGDADGNGAVDFSDVLSAMAAWGACGGCIEDMDGDGFVDFQDVLLLLAAWGPCP